MIGTIYIVYLIIGILLGGFYYHHIWLEVCSLDKNNIHLLLRFWVRFSALTLTLALMFHHIPESIPWIASGVFLAKPVYIYMRKKTIFEVSDGK